MDNPVVIDYGSDTLKGGFANKVPSMEEPSVRTPCCVEVRYPASASGEGEPVASSSGGPGPPGASGGASILLSPVQHGRIVSLDAFEALLHYTLYELLGWTMGEEGALLVSEPALTSKSDREALCQLAFETFNVCGAYWQDQPVLALYALGRTLGCVVDIGHESVTISPVADGATHAAAVATLPYGAEALQALLASQMAGSATAPPLLAWQLRQLKELAATAAPSREAYARLASACEGDGAAPPNTSYTLPDGTVIALPTATGAALGEALLRPRDLLGCESPSLAEGVVEAVGLVPEPTARRSLFESVFVCGGGAAVPGLVPRLQRELRSAAPLAAVAPSLVAVPEYMAANTARFAPWVGGAVLSKVVSAQNLFMTKADYDEGGPSSVHRKCA